MKSKWYEKKMGRKSKEKKKDDGFHFLSSRKQVDAHLKQENLPQATAHIPRPKSQYTGGFSSTLTANWISKHR